MRFFNSAFLICMILGGCVSASEHKDRIADPGPAGAPQNLTVGAVQRQIRVGMSSADVIQALGSPNIVSTDEQRREVWVYDKIATDVSYSQSRDYATLILIGTARSQGASSTSQRTLTVVIKFDEQNKVKDFAYHQSQF